MDDPAKRLRAQLDEDKRHALDAGGTEASRHWTVNSDEDVKLRDHDDWIAVGPYGGSVGDAAAHIARHDPARVLREIAAKQRTLINRSEAFKAYEAARKTEQSEYPNPSPEAVREVNQTWAALQAWDAAVKTLAAVYDDDEQG